MWAQRTNIVSIWAQHREQILRVGKLSVQLMDLGLEHSVLFKGREVNSSGARFVRQSFSLIYIYMSRIS